jgi:hypothetical protein
MLLAQGQCSAALGVIARPAEAAFAGCDARRLSARRAGPN